MITPNVANTVGLMPIGKVPLMGIGGAVTYHNGYLFHVAFTIPIAAPLPASSVPARQQVMIFVQAQVIHGGELTSAAGFDVLLGMDILSTGALHIEGNGTFSFSF